MTPDDDLRRAFAGDQPPAELWPRISRSLDAEAARVTSARRSPGLRRTLVGLAAVIVLVVVGAISLNPFGSSRQTIATVAAVPVDEFRTFVESGRSIDFVSADPDDIRAWFEPRLGQPVPNPSPGDADVRLAGARLCWLLDRRVASLMYVVEGDQASLYVLHGADLPAADSESPTVIRRDDLTAVIWRSGASLLILVTPLAPEPALTVAALVAPVP